MIPNFEQQVEDIKQIKLCELPFNLDLEKVCQLVQVDEHAITFADLEKVKISDLAELILFDPDLEIFLAFQEKGLIQFKPEDVPPPINVFTDLFKKLPRNFRSFTLPELVNFLFRNKHDIQSIKEIVASLEYHGLVLYRIQPIDETTSIFDIPLHKSILDQLNDKKILVLGDLETKTVYLDQKCAIQLANLCTILGIQAQEIKHISLLNPATRDWEGIQKIRSKSLRSIIQQHFESMREFLLFLEENSVENLACELRIRRERAQIIRSRIIPSVVEQ